MDSSRPIANWSWFFLVVLLLIQLWTAHALVFFSPEYAHSVTAWLLGWKSNPLALNYAHPTLKVLLAQIGIDQNVNETPIFANGHGRDAALIAAAGMVIGNGLISYPLSRLSYAWAKRRNLRGWAIFFYWTTVASIGNFIDYVPLRMFSASGDMYSLERGFGWSPWTVLFVLGIPTACVLLYFLLRIQPSTVVAVPRLNSQAAGLGDPDGRRALELLRRGRVARRGADGLPDVESFCLCPAFTCHTHLLDRRATLCKIQRIVIATSGWSFTCRSLPLLFIPFAFFLSV